MMLLQPKVLLMLAKPLILDIIRDVISSNVTTDNMVELQAKVKSSIMELVGKTHFTWDDDLAQLIFEKVIEGQVVDQFTEILLCSAEGWVQSSETAWDDEWVLPAITQLRQAIVSEE